MDHCSSARTSACSFVLKQACERLGIGWEELSTEPSLRVNNNQGEEEERKRGSFGGILLVLRLFVGQLK